MLAASLAPNEADVMRKLRPIDRIQEYVLGTDWHQAADPAAVSAR